MQYAATSKKNLFLSIKTAAGSVLSVGKISRPTRLFFIFLLFGSTWILTSDWIVIKIVGNNPSILQEVMGIKGILFILFSGAFMYNIDKTLYRKIDETAARNEELIKHYQALTSASKEAIYECDLTTHTMYVNDYLKKIFGFPENQMTYNHEMWKEKVHPADYARVSENIVQQITGKRTSWEDEYCIKDTTGEYRHIRHSSYLVMDADGKPSYIIGALQDVSEMRQLEKIYFEEKIKKETQLMQAIVEAEEKERNRWAEELHDNIGQLLAVTKLYADSIKETSIPSKTILENLKATIATAIAEIRQLSCRLKPPAFADETLESAIRRLTSNINRVKDIRFSLYTKNFKDNDLKDEHKLMTYRIIQEQLSNITRYAEANYVNISIEKNNNQVMVRIKDDGKGFDPTKQSAGIGLKNIRSRLKAFKGKADIQSMPGHGCNLFVTFNLN